MVKGTTGSTVAYEAPAIVDLGAFHELTLTDPCNKDVGAGDGFTFQQTTPIHCTSS